MTEKLPKKYPCEDCEFCQFCSDSRCNMCRGGHDKGKKCDNVHKRAGTDGGSKKGPVPPAT